jgi:hypothetical protein
LRDYRLTCGWIVVCDRCVIVLCLLDPDLGPKYLMYSCNPPWALATCTFDHIIIPSKVLFIQGWLTTPGWSSRRRPLWMTQGWVAHPGCNLSESEWYGLVIQRLLYKSLIPVIQGLQLTG